MMPGKKRKGAAMTAAKFGALLATRRAEIRRDSFGYWVVGFYLLHNIVVCLWLLTVDRGHWLGLLVAFFACFSAGVTIAALILGIESIGSRLVSSSFYCQLVAGILLTSASFWPIGSSAANLGFLLPGIGCLIWGGVASLMLIIASG
jgi:hypothetical protein